MSQALIIAVVAFGSLLNLLAKPWSSTDSLLERRRNDIVAILLWACLTVVTVLAVRHGARLPDGPDAFDLQDWTALVLPWALAAPYLLELAATLVRQVEMWRWMSSATAALPIAWMYRTCTVGEIDDDGEWLRERAWSPWASGETVRIPLWDSRCSLWGATSREGSLYNLFVNWLAVLSSSTKYVALRVRRTSAIAAREKDLGQAVRFLQFVVLLFGVVFLLVFASFCTMLSSLEVGLLLIFDIMAWKRCFSKGKIIPRHKTVHFGRQELQQIFEQSRDLRTRLAISKGLSFTEVHKRLMRAAFTTAAVLENSFRRAYLVVPVYDHCISNRKALRNHYAYVGCDLDLLIKNIRVLLELRHTAGLLSITSSTGTVEAALHNNIESILSVSLYFKGPVLYNITSHIARIEHQIEGRLAIPSTLPESRTRERVVYIDARNAVFWLLWTIVVRDWTEPRSLWESEESGKLSASEAEEIVKEFPFERIEIVYIVATFLSRCRYCARYGIDSELGFYDEVRALVLRHGEQAVHDEFISLSDALKQHRGLTLLEWTSNEYDLKWLATEPNKGPLQCSWNSDTGKPTSAFCKVAIGDG